MPLWPLDGQLIEDRKGNRFDLIIEVLEFKEIAVVVNARAPLEKPQVWTIGTRVYHMGDRLHSHLAVGYVDLYSQSSMRLAAGVAVCTPAPSKRSPAYWSALPDLRSAQS